MGAARLEQILPGGNRVAKHKAKRIPKLRFTTLRGIGWHFAYRDSKSGSPRKHRLRT